VNRAAVSLTRRPAAAAAETTLPGIPASVPAARRFAAAGLAGCPRADDLILAVSELASNAVAHSASGQGGSYTVRIRTAPRWARAEVTDSGPALSPRRRRNGWGLGIVAAVADRSGAVIGADGTRTAFAEVTWPPP
jgi:signal transduction histidine kinase